MGCRRGIPGCIVFVVRSYQRAGRVGVLRTEEWAEPEHTQPAARNFGTASPKQRSDGWHRLSASRITGVERLPEDAFANINVRGVVLGDGSDTMVVFSDHTCRYCAMLWDTIAAVLDSNEDVALRFRHMVTPSMGTSFAVAVAAECAAEQGHFVEFTDALFGQPDAIEEVSMERWAYLSGITDLQAFGDCMESNRTAAVVLDDMNAAIDLELSGTPTVVTPRVRITGALSRQPLLELPLLTR